MQKVMIKKHVNSKGLDRTAQMLDCTSVQSDQSLCCPHILDPGGINRHRIKALAILHRFAGWFESWLVSNRLSHLFEGHALFVFSISNSRLFID